MFRWTEQVKIHGKRNCYICRRSCFWCMVKPFDNNQESSLLLQGYRRHKEKIRHTKKCGRQQDIQRPCKSRSTKYSYEKLVEVYWQQTDQRMQWDNSWTVEIHCLDCMYLSFRRLRKIAEASKQPQASGRFKRYRNKKCRPLQALSILQKNIIKISTKEGSEHYKRYRVGHDTFIGILEIRKRASIIYDNF